MYESLISVSELSELIKEKNCQIFDSRYSLTDVSAGRKAYLEAHIPSAVYVDLGKDLSAIPDGTNGRHPLPEPDSLREGFSSLGINSGLQTVVYDDAGGSFAARMWWLLRYMGHMSVAVLDGGWQRWLAEAGPVESGFITPEHRQFQGQSRREWLVRLEEVEGQPLLVDSREAARFSGEVEPVDPVAGHIPGALNYCWKNNLAENGLFLSPRELRQQIEKILGGRNAAESVFYCGSGVTACHNLLAAAHAGLEAPRLYAGSWSEWCQHKEKPIARGA